MAEAPHVVILGAGFAGVGALKKLQKASVRVTLIDKNDYHTFLPLLYQVATGELSPSEVGFPLREMVDDRPDWTFRQANVTNIDLENKTVSGDGLEPLSYDYLVVGLGASANFFGTKGAPDNSYPMYSMHDAVRLKDHILERLHAVNDEPALADDGALTFCVVGGGATGVEVSGAISDLLHAEMEHEFPALPIQKAEVHLYEMGPNLLAPFKANLQEYAKGALEEREVQVHLGEGVVEIEPTRVHLKSGDTVKAHTLVWGAGIAPSPMAGALDAETERGRAIVEPDLSLKDHPEVFVLGDMAMITDTKTHKQLPQLGSVAQQSGQQAAENIARLVKGKQTESFAYVDKGTMATVGFGAALVQLKSERTMTGHAAWLAWLGVHLMLLSGGEQKAHTFVDWGSNLFTDDRRKHLFDE